MTNEVLFFVFIFALFATIHLTELAARRIALLWFFSFRRVRLYLSMAVLLLLIGTVYCPDTTQAFISFLVKTSIDASKLVVGAIQDAFNST